MKNLIEIEPEYVYVTIPAEYVCVYHRILAMLADYGLDMLKDCKATCTERNSGVIECFNMFNSAVACRQLGRLKEAALIIKYIKAKINQIYRNKDNSTSFVFPVDEKGELKAFVSCGERPKFEINPDDMHLYKTSTGNGFVEGYYLGKEDYSQDSIKVPPTNKDETTSPVEEIKGLKVVLVPNYKLVDGKYYPNVRITVTYDGQEVALEDTIYQLYFDDAAIESFDTIGTVAQGIHNFKCVVSYNDETKLINIDKLCS